MNLEIFNLFVVGQTMTTDYHKHHVGLVACEFLVESVGGKVAGPPPNQVTRRHGGGRRDRSVRD